MSRLTTRPSSIGSYRSENMVSAQWLRCKNNSVKDIATDEHIKALKSLVAKVKERYGVDMNREIQDVSGHSMRYIGEVTSGRCITADKVAEITKWCEYLLEENE